MPNTYSTPARHAARALVLGALVLVAGRAGAQDATPALDRAHLTLGAYYPSISTRLSGQAADVPLDGTFDMEDDLGLARHKKIPRARADLLIGEHEGLALDYYSVNRSRDMTLARDIDYNGSTFHASARAHSRLDFDFGSVAWRWWLSEGNDAFGLGLGGGWYQVRGSLSAQASVTGPQVDQTAQAQADTHLHAWAPLLQVGWRHAFNDHWRMYVDASGVKKNGGQLYGHIYNAAIGVAWYPWAHFGLAAEYDYSRIHLIRNRSAYDLRLDMKLDGPSVYAILRW